MRMRKILLSAVFLSVPFNFIDVPKIPGDIPEIPDIDYIRREIPKSDSSFATFSDSGYSEIEINFNPNQTVYIKVNIDSNYDVVAELTLLDASKKEIFRTSMNRNGNVYTSQLNAPSTPGVYYVHVEIKGNGLSFIGERNINVGDTSGQAVVEVDIENVVKGESSYGTDSDQDIAEPTQIQNKDSLETSASPSLMFRIKTRLTRFLQALGHYFNKLF